VPLIWPPIEIAGRRYVDGGVRSSTNLDLARGVDRVVVLLAHGGGTPRLGDTPVLAISADAESVRARGGQSLSARTQSASSAAGRAQGARVAAAVRAFWS
jgi:NTE family protein